VHNNQHTKKRLSPAAPEHSLALHFTRMQIPMCRLQPRSPPFIFLCSLSLSHTHSRSRLSSCNTFSFLWIPNERIPVHHLHLFLFFSLFHNSHFFLSFSFPFGFNHLRVMFKQSEWHSTFTGQLTLETLYNKFICFTAAVDVVVLQLSHNNFLPCLVSTLQSSDSLFKRKSVLEMLVTSVNTLHLFY